MMRTSDHRSTAVSSFFAGQFPDFLPHAEQVLAQNLSDVVLRVPLAKEVVNEGGIRGYIQEAGRQCEHAVVVGAKPDVVNAHQLHYMIDVCNDVLDRAHRPRLSLSLEVGDAFG